MIMFTGLFCILLCLPFGVCLLFFSLFIMFHYCFPPILCLPLPLSLLFLNRYPSHPLFLFITSIPLSHILLPIRLSHLSLRYPHSPRKRNCETSTQSRPKRQICYDHLSCTKTPATTTTTLSPQTQIRCICMLVFMFHTNSHTIESTNRYGGYNNEYEGFGIFSASSIDAFKMFASKSLVHIALIVLLVGGELNPIRYIFCWCDFSIM